MKELGGKLHLWWAVRIVWRKGERRTKHAILKRRVLRPPTRQEQGEREIVLVYVFVCVGKSAPCEEQLTYTQPHADAHKGTKLCQQT